MESTSPTKPDKKKNSYLTDGYLLFYNLAQTVGWFLILIRSTNYYLCNSEEESNISLYETVKWPLLIFQIAALLEVFHAIIRIVPSSPTAALQQIVSRNVVVCGTMATTLAATQTIAFPLCMFTYSTNEILRYGYYVLSILNALPYPILWLRYTAFIICYPIGLIGEMMCLYYGYQEMSELPLTSSDTLFYVKYLVLGFLVFYAPMFFRLYFYMFAQRRKVLGKPKGAETKKKVN